MAKKEKITLQELIVQTPELKSSLLKFENVKLQLDKAAETCLQIKVTDENSLAVCENQMGKVNELIKAVEFVRVAEKKPYFEKCKAIDSAAAYVSESSEEALNHLKNEKIAYIRKVEAENKRKLELNNAFIKLKEYLEEKLNQSDGMLNFKTIIAKLEEPVNKEKWQELTEQVELSNKNYLTLFKLKEKELEGGSTNIIDDAINKAMIEEAKANIESADVPKVEVEVISKVRRLWTFEVVDINSVPKELLMVDESKVKEYLKANSDSLEDGKVVNGIKYYKDLKVTV